MTTLGIAFKFCWYFGISYLTMFSRTERSCLLIKYRNRRIKVYAWHAQSLSRIKRGHSQLGLLLTSVSYFDIFYLRMFCVTSSTR